MKKMKGWMLSLLVCMPMFALAEEQDHQKVMRYEIYGASRDHVVRSFFFHNVKSKNKGMTDQQCKALFSNFDIEITKGEPPETVVIKEGAQLLKDYKRQLMYKVVRGQHIIVLSGEAIYQKEEKDFISDAYVFGLTDESVHRMQGVVVNHDCIGSFISTTDDMVTDR